MFKDNNWLDEIIWSINKSGKVCEWGSTRLNKWMWMISINGLRSDDETK